MPSDMSRVEPEDASTMPVTTTTAEYENGELLTAGEASKRFGISGEQLWRHANRGRIGFTQLGPRAWRYYRASDVAQLVADANHLRREQHDANS